MSRLVSTCDAPIKVKLGGVIEKGNPSLLHFCAQEGRRGCRSDLNSCCCTTVKLGGWQHDPSQRACLPIILSPGPLASCVGLCTWTCVNPSNPVFIWSIQINGQPLLGRASFGFGSGASVDWWLHPAVNLVLCSVLSRPNHTCRCIY